VALKPDHPEGWRRIGVILKDTGRFREAIEPLQQAILVAPRDAQLRFELGVCYLQVRNKDAALEQYKVLKTMDDVLAARLYRSITS